MNNDLWKAINRLYGLLQSGTHSERHFQEYFEENPVVFQVLGFDVAKPFDQRSGNRLPIDSESGFERQPDFICANRSTGEITVFEIKPPTEKSMLTASAQRRRVKFRAEVNTHLVQTSDYVRFVRGNSTSRARAKDTLELQHYSVCTGILMCGLSSLEDDRELARLMSQYADPRIRLITYDNLLDLLVSAFAQSRIDVLEPGTKMSGSTLVLVMTLPLMQINHRAVITEIGDDNARILLLIENEKGFIVCIDQYGHERRLECSLPKERPFTIKFEVSSDSTSILPTYLLTLMRWTCDK